MRLGLMLGYSGKKIALPIDLIKRAESLGFDSVWTAEAYGSDAVSAASWILAKTEKIRVGTAIMQMPARTPALCAMTAMTLSQLSNGRFIVGLGASGPQVVEGWHGVPYGKPITRTREYIEIMRKIMLREGPVEYAGEIYHLPYKEAGATGLGKPLKSILAAEPNIPIYTAQITAKGLACAGEFADGVFPIWMDPEKYPVLGEHIEAGLNKVPGKSLANFDVAPFVTAIMADDIEQCRWPVKQHLALYIGGMGARGKNFYTQYAIDLGYEDAAIKIQDLYLAGEKDKAAAAVPNELVDSIALLGPKEHIKERLAIWKKAGAAGHVGSMIVGLMQPELLELLAEEIL